MKSIELFVKSQQEIQVGSYVSAPLYNNITSDQLYEIRVPILKKFDIGTKIIIESNEKEEQKNEVIYNRYNHDKNFCFLHFEHERFIVPYSVIGAIILNGALAVDRDLPAIRKFRITRQVRIIVGRKNTGNDWHTHWVDVYNTLIENEIILYQNESEFIFSNGEKALTNKSQFVSCFSEGFGVGSFGQMIVLGILKEEF